jgi:DnaJ-class molecular chaperone
MSTGGTSVFRAATSRQVKQELVRLLFGKQYARTGPEGHQKMLDYSMYAYGDLKKAYLERAQEIHPDKNKSNNNVDNNNKSKHSKHQFHELQDAWDKYEELAKAMKKVKNGETANFTMFGVGCSFSDNEQERALRDEITDQACRGWFSSGSIAAATSAIHDEETKPTIYFKAEVSLVDEDMFEEVSEDHSREKDGKERSSRLATLIPGWKRQ